MTDPRAARRTLLSAALISLVLGAGSVSAQEAAPEPEAAAPAEKPKPKRPAPKPVAKSAPKAEAKPTEKAKAAWPEGASAVSEVYGDWTVNCSRAESGSTCSLMQSQGDAKTGRRSFAVELKAPKEGRAEGVILMPFGFAIEPGVAFKLDDTNLGKGAPFSTCAGDGCLVPISLPTLATDTMRTAKTLAIAAQKPGEKEPTVINVPLAGFAPAFDRMIALGG
ncbi:MULTISPECIES: invasion associated locus B family protein [Methylobacterium]|uniref:Invasion protein n=1 Tax=Methylobacterium jeotgali TaxID=381630 RepID=A0ABQ4SXN4_9HYPH|nr:MULTISPECIES: invasion associated locus B family protein [Methylobacterium]PIU07931.1 MAG: invasion protein [Methylobacterium sp. CG09_land_8_20_14_0_10_71_15]PIU13741.1 MAG: invasion protein [Methylobacterium sp. CG08_land_8_20_14_0_20_71_15]GBU17076.1 hypothetical protein AwMethylo_12910 [Methylobacterium sp.]GJE06653.1 hypothetical protein AOPFMNJM_1975 [Methylobacterium jeotgali]